MRFLFVLTAAIVSIAGCPEVRGDCVPVDKAHDRPFSKSYSYIPRGIGELTADGDKPVLCTLASPDDSTDLSRTKCWTIELPGGRLRERSIVKTPTFRGDTVTSTDGKHVAAFRDGQTPHIEISDASTQQVVHAIPLPSGTMFFQLAFLGHVVIADVAVPNPADPIPTSTTGLLAIKHVVLAIRDDGTRLPDLGSSFWLVDDHRVTAWDDYVQHLTVFDTTTGRRVTVARDASADPFLLAEQACLRKPIADRPPAGCRYGGDLSSPAQLFDQPGLSIVPVPGGFLIAPMSSFAYDLIDDATLATKAHLTAKMCH